MLHLKPERETQDISLLRRIKVSFSSTVSEILYCMTSLLYLPEFFYERKKEEMYGTMLLVQGAVVVCWGGWMGEETPCADKITS